MADQVALVSEDADFALKSRNLLAAEHLELEVFKPREFVPTQLLLDRPSVVLMDIRGKGARTELELIQSMRCREHLRKIPIIVILEHASRDTILSVREAGIRHVLAKSGDQEILLEKIRLYCRTSSYPPASSPSPGPKEHTAPVEWSDPATTAFKKQVKREVSRRLETLPSLPVVVTEIMKLVESDNSCASDFEEHISHDQALTARLLRIANSSFFAQSRTIKSIRDAIVILGLRTLKSLVMAASTSNLLHRQADGYGYLAGGLWKHSIACALGSRLLATKLGRGNQEAEAFFVQGLLHDIGKLLLNNFVVEKAEQFREAMEGRGLSLLESETLIMGTDHCSVGARIAERWNLPREVAGAIEYHHHPRRAGATLRKQAALIHTVNHWCHQLEIGMVPQTFVKSELDTQAIQEIKLDETLLQNRREEFAAQLEQMKELFSMIGQE